MRPWVLIMIVLRIFSAHAFCARKASVWKGKRHGLIDWHYPSSYSRPIISSRKRFAIVSGSSDPNDDSVPVDRDEEEEETSHVPTPPNTPPFVEAQLLQDVDQAYYMVHLYEQEVEMLREKLGYMQDELLDEQNEFRIQKKTWTETLETFSQELSKRDAELNALHALLKEQRSNNDNTIANDSNEENQEPENDNGSTAAATVKGVDSEQNMQVPPPKPDSSLPLKPKRFANFKKFGLLKKERPKLNKATIAKMGTSVVLSYSFVSNIFAISSMSIAWYIFSRKVSRGSELDISIHVVSKAH